eukprot:PhF_6_TR29201/c0_g1_i1/m.42723
MENVIKALYTEYVLPDDDFFVRLRKFCIVLVFLSVPFHLAVGAMYFSAMFEHGTTPASLVNLYTGWCHLPLCSILPWIELRKTKRVSDSTLVKWMGGMMLGPFLGFIGTSAQVFGTTPFLFIQIIYFADLPHKTFFTCASFVMILFYAYQTSFPSFGYSDLRVPGVKDPPAVLIGFSVSMVGFWLMMFMILRLQHKEYVRSQSIVKASSELCFAVSRKLMKYDTEGAKKALAKISQETMVDDRFIVAMNQLIVNLDKYKPYIPNYASDFLLQSEESMSDIDTMSTMTEDQPQQNQLFLPASSNTSTDHDLGGSSMTTLSALTTIARVCAIADSLIDPPHSDDLDGSGRFSENSSNSVISQHRNVTIGWFHIQVGPNEDMYESSINRVINRIHRAAKATGTLLHSFVGDVVVASWNTTTPLVGHCVKSSVFASRLQISSGDANIQIFGALSSGMGVLYIAGSKQKTLTVHIAWKCRLQMLSNLSRKYETMLVCHSTQEGAEKDVAFQWVDCIKCDKHAVDVYELIREKIDDLNIPGEGPSQIQDLCVQCQYADALEIVRDKLESGFVQSKCMRHLYDKLFYVVEHKIVKPFDQVEFQ